MKEVLLGHDFEKLERILGLVQWSILVSVDKEVVVVHVGSGLATWLGLGLSTLYILYIRISFNCYFCVLGPNNNSLVPSFSCFSHNI